VSGLGHNVLSQAPRLHNAKKIVTFIASKNLWRCSIRARSADNVTVGNFDRLFVRAEFSSAR
jgi:hypothetical protein